MRSAIADHYLEVDMSAVVRSDISRPIDAVALWGVADSLLAAAPHAAQDIYNSLCEAVSNVRDHAYPGSAELAEWLGWEVSARVEPDLQEAVFTVRDQGIGIVASIAGHPGVKALTPADAVRFAVTARDAPLDGPWRGRGLSGMVALVGRREGWTLDILSSGQLLSFSRSSPAGDAVEVCPGIGTLIRFRVPLHDHAGGSHG